MGVILSVSALRVYKALGTSARRSTGPARSGRRGSTEAQDAYGTRIKVTQEGVAYGQEFVPFDEVVGLQPASPGIWNPATNLFEVAVLRRNGPDLIVRNLPLQTAERLRSAIARALRERDG